MVLTRAAAKRLRKRTPSPEPVRDEVIGMVLTRAAAKRLRKRTPSPEPVRDEVIGRSVSPIYKYTAGGTMVFSPDRYEGPLSTHPPAREATLPYNSMPYTTELMTQPLTVVRNGKGETVPYCAK